MHQRTILIVSKLVSWLDITLCVAELIWISVFRRKGTLFDLCSSNNANSSNNNFALLLFGVSVQDLWSIGVKYRDVYRFLMWKGGFLAEGGKKKSVWNKRILLRFNFQNGYRNTFFKLCVLFLSLQQLQQLQLRPVVQLVAWQEQQTDHFALWERSSLSPSLSSSLPTTWPPARFMATTLSAAIPRAAPSSLRALPSLPTPPWGLGAAALSVPRWGRRWEALEQQVGAAALSQLWL